MMQDSPLEAYLDFIRSALQSVGRILCRGGTIRLMCEAAHPPASFVRHVHEEGKTS